MRDRTFEMGRHLGSLCLKGHEYESTGQSIRSASGHCIECNRIRKANGRPVKPRIVPIGGRMSKEQTKAHARKFYAENRALVAAQRRARRLARLEVMREKERAQKVNQRKSDESRKYARDYYGKNAVRIRLRNRIFRALVTYSTSGKIYKTAQYGIDIPAIIKQLGPRPKGDWHIDHIRPLALFDFDDEDQIRRAFAPEKENQYKGAKPYEQYLADAGRLF
jgi:hypothetical protein